MITTQNERKVVLFIAASLDGFIAAPNDDLSFLSMVEKPGEDYGYAAFIETVDTVIIGRKTYDWVMKQVPTFPHQDKETYVITRHEKTAIGKTVFYTGCLMELVRTLKQKEGKNIFVDGGAMVVNELLNELLIDEIILSIIPVILGDGTRLFQRTVNQTLWLKQCKQFDTGLVQLHYVRAGV